MEDPNLPVICRECGRTVEVRNIRFDESSKQYICTTCFNASKNMTELKSVKKETKAGEDGSDAVKKVNYQCAECKYKFSRPVDKPPNDCPYCGKKVFEMRDYAAKKLLDEADGWT